MKARHTKRTRPTHESSSIITNVPSPRKEEHKQSNRPILVFIIISIFVIGFLVFGFNRWVTEHNYGVNVGGGSTVEHIARPLKKPLQCNEDKDCPAETKCSPGGLCTPILVHLPSAVMAQPGSGRADEKGTR